MKKVLCVIFALVLCMAVVFTGCDDTTGNQGGSVEDNSALDAFLSSDAVGDIRSDNEIQEGETTVETHVPEEVEIFVRGNYYIDGVIYSSGDAMKVQLSTDGANVQVTANVSGLSFGMLVLNGTTYVIQPAAKIYTELSSALLAALGLDKSFSVDEFKSIADQVGEEEIYNLKQSKVTINGEAGLCNEYNYEDATVKLYSVGEKLIQVDNYDEKGVLTMQIVIDEITPTIPADQLTLKGLEKASITSFISSFFSLAGVN